MIPQILQKERYVRSFIVFHSITLIHENWDKTFFIIIIFFTIFFMLKKYILKSWLNLGADHSIQLVFHHIVLSIKICLLYFTKQRRTVLWTAAAMINRLLCCRFLLSAIVMPLSS